jgi:hypothetical protein
MRLEKANWKQTDALMILYRIEWYGAITKLYAAAIGRCKAK